MTLSRFTAQALVAIMLMMIAMPMIAQTRGTTPDRVSQRKAVARTIQALRMTSGIDYQFAHTKAKPMHEAKELTAKLLHSAGGSISGTVKLPANIKGPATVVAFTSASPNASVYVADAAPNGTYTINDIPAGSYHVLAQAVDCAPEYFDNAATQERATSVTVVEGRIRSGIDFSLEVMQVGEGTITGKVVSDVDGDVVTGGEVYAMSLDAPYMGSWSQIESDGTYAIPGLYSGRYVVQAAAPGFLAEFYDNASYESATSVTVTEPGTRADINFSLSAGATIAGRVVDADGRPIAGALINAMTDQRGGEDSVKNYPPDHGYGYGVAVSDEEGRYEITGIPGGDYVISASYWSTWFEVVEYYDNASTFETATVVNAVVNRTTSAIDFVLDVPTFDGAVRGVITDKSGAPFEGAYVMVQSGTDGPYHVYANAITGSDGSYVVEGLPDGEYLVGAMSQDLWKMSMRWWDGADAPEDADLISIVAGVTDVASVDIALNIDRGTASISGTVRLSDGTPAAGAVVGIVVIDPNDSNVIYGSDATSDENGNYTISYLPDGRFHVHATLWQEDKVGNEWYLNASDPATATPVVLADGEVRTGVDFSLDLVSYYGTVEGRVNDDASGAPIANAFVELQPSGSRMSPGLGFGYTSAYALTGSDGRYVIDKVWSGEYFAVVIADGAYEYHSNSATPYDALPVTVRGDETTTLDFGLTQRSFGVGSISGTVNTVDGRRIDAAVIRAIPEVSIGDVYFPSVAQPSGAYSINGLADGNYYVYAYSPDHIAEFYEDAWDISEAVIISVRNGSAVTGIDFGLESFRMVEDNDPARQGAGGSGSVHGKVTDTDGRALADANVYVVDATKKAVVSARTKADGTYELAGLIPGADYRLMASSVGYASEYNDDARRFEDATPVTIRRGSTTVNFALAAGTGGIDDREAGTNAITIAGVYPNPFTATTSLRFALAKQSNVNVTVVNALGETMVQLHNGMLASGMHELDWNGRSSQGAALSSGVYFVRVTSGTSVLTTPITLSR